MPSLYRAGNSLSNDINLFTQFDQPSPHLVFFLEIIKNRLEHRFFKVLSDDFSLRTYNAPLGRPFLLNRPKLRISKIHQTFSIIRVFQESKSEQQPGGIDQFLTLKN